MFTQLSMQTNKQKPEGLKATDLKQKSDMDK